MDGLAIDRSRGSPNHGPRLGSGRPDCIILHYTGMRDERSAVSRLCDPAAEVSCHYVVTETGGVLQLVDEDRRAWHAGRSSWKGETDLNSASIGIEIVNGGHDFGLPPFPKTQIGAVTALCRDIMRRHGIRPERVLGHSDVAPGRKRDPGERFPWRELAQAGVGLWPDPNASSVSTEPDERIVEANLGRIGYGLAYAGSSDTDTGVVLRAFQRRYRPEIIDGIADAQTAALADAVLRMHEVAV